MQKTSPTRSDGELQQRNKLTQTQMNGVSPPTLAQPRQGLSSPAAQDTHTRTHIPSDTGRKRSPLVDTHAVGRFMADLTGLRPTLIHPYLYTNTRATVSVTSASWISPAERWRGRNLWSWHCLDTHCLDFFTHINTQRHKHKEQADSISWASISWSFCLVSGSDSRPCSLHSGVHCFSSSQPSTPRDSFPLTRHNIYKKNSPVKFIS